METPPTGASPSKFNGTLKVSVVDCTNVPKPDRFGSLNPYVNITFQGIKKKTSYKKAEANPTWNESFELDLKGTSLMPNDVIEVQIKDYANLGSDRLLAKGAVPLTKLIGNGSLKCNVDLTDPDNNKLESTKMKLNLEYTPPTSPPTGPKAAPISGGDVSTVLNTDAGSNNPGGREGDGGGDSPSSSHVHKESKQRSNKLQDFQIRIKVYEARQLDGNNIHPMCRIKCSNTLKNTKKIRSTNNPYWDEVFFFNFHSSAADLFDENIEFQVFNSQSFLVNDSIIGNFKIDIGYIYDEPHHSIINKWLLLGDPEDCMSGAKGYLKVTVNVLGTGDEVPTIIGAANEDDIESNLLKPAGMMLRSATFVLKLFKAEDLPRMDSNVFEGIKSIFSSNEQKKDLIDPYVLFSFAGKTVQSKIIYNDANPQWNQELRMGIKFPSMCNKIKIAVKDWDRTKEDDFNSVIFLPMSMISDLQADGFLPTFGPCFINMYGAPREFSEFPTKLDELNVGKGDGVAYRGRLLIELQTILGESPTEVLADIKNTELVRVEPMLHRKKYKLHAAFLDATMISETDKPIEFEVSIGNYGNKLDENVPPSSSTTPPCNPVFDGCSYYLLPWGNIKPCMQIVSYWEDITYRLESINQLKKLRLYIESSIATIKSRLEMFGENVNVNSPEMSQLAISILKMIETIKQKATMPLPEPVAGKHHPNELDKLLKKTRTQALKMLAKKCDKLPNMGFKNVIDELTTFNQILIDIEQDPQNCIPDVIIWMLCGNERKAYYRIPAHDIMYSSNSDCKGELCTKLQTITMKWPGKEAEDQKDKIPAQLRLKLWFGFEKDESDWLDVHRNEELNGAISIFAETYENQTYSWTGLRWSSEGLSRPNFSDSTGKLAIPKDKFTLPAGWEWTSDWYMAPEFSLSFDKDAGHTQFTEELYEQNCRALPGANWDECNEEKKPYKWTDSKGDKTTSRDEVKLSDHWKWDDEWNVDTNRAGDNEGWEYCIEPSMGGWLPSEKIYHLYRRRRWIRNRSITNPTESQALKKKEIEDAVKEGWEYSKFFSTKFHAKEESTDSVRRRRWHRAMQPINSEANLNVVFSFDNTDNKEKSDKINLNAPRMFLKYKNPNRYQLRVYLYQARSLPAGDDDTSLSDPFAQVIFVTQSMKTEIVKKTLSPTWDQTLIFDTVEIHGDPNEIQANPPNVMIEVFDHDAFFMDMSAGANKSDGRKDFLGRCMCKPVVRTEDSTQPKLEWIQLKRDNNENAGELLACFELFMLDDNNASKLLPPFPTKIGALYKVPDGIRPVLQRNIIEILAWGVRNMKTFQLSDVDRPQVIFECGGHKTETEVIKNVKKNPNFNKPVLYFDIMLPKEEIYIPPMNINVLDHRQFGRKPIVGVHVIKSLSRFRINRDKDTFILSNIEALQNADSTTVELGADSDRDGAATKPKKSAKKKLKKFLNFSSTPQSPSELTRRNSKFSRANKAFGLKTVNDLSLVEDDIDWWCKFYASLGDRKKCGTYLSKGYEKLTIYTDELEKHKCFDYFTDFCERFELIRGKTTSEEENITVGEFKGTFKIYPVSEDATNIADNLIFKNTQPMTNEECIVRVYIVRGVELQAKDSNGKSDPFVQIEVGKTKADNRDKYIPNSVNPEFGRMFELKVVLPIQKDLCIRIKDYDLIGTDEIIGETWIDLENRMLTKHRSTCGLPLAFNETGPNKWRDSRLPSQILLDACKVRNLTCLLPNPGETTLKINNHTYSLDKFEPKPPKNRHLGSKDERLCLHVLHQFSLVPEHVETRKLYNPIQPGIEQGRLQMWVDIFPKSLGPPGPAFDISPRKPKKYVLRCIIWNTSEVPCDDIELVTGEAMSDIYLKGWLQGLEENIQQTDIHYRSMDGDGNFNWRFTFDFDYLPAEQNIVIKKKEHFWSLDETETKIPPILSIQVWDNDKFSADDFLGQLSLNLNHMIKPAKEASKCGLHQLPEINADHTDNHGSDLKHPKYVSLFEAHRLRGWWPCIVELPDNQREMAGKVEMELEILTEEEAKEKPAGRGREEPNENPRLEPPNRPETSFLWFASPLKTFKHILWGRYKWYIITFLILAILIIFLLLMLYSLPSAMWTAFFSH